MKLSALRMLLPSYRDQRRVAAILDALADHSQGLTGHELQLTTGMPVGKLYLTLARLRDHGQIRTWTTPTGDPAAPPAHFYGLLRRSQ